jgi:hypothetical protein
MKVNEKDVPAGTVLRDLEEIYSSLEPALSRQRSGNVRERDGMDLGHNDMAVAHSIATSYFHVTALPKSHRARDFASSNSLAELFREDHCLVPE